MKFEIILNEISLDVKSSSDNNPNTKSMFKKFHFLIMFCLKCKTKLF